MFDKQGRYVIENYVSKPTFSSFLPGIAGPMGVPAWCFYVNRGQAVCSFGGRDRDHAIMEFSPAYCAYRDVGRRGFRTFCLVNGAYRELFTARPDMHIGLGELEITDSSGGLDASALYFGLPGERSAALVRALTVRNTSGEPLDLELLDGMPEVVPYGVNHEALKNMANLAAAWMRVENLEKGAPLFRVRASMEDSARVTQIRGCNFALGFAGSGNLLHPLVDQRLVFGEDTSLTTPEGFLRAGLAGLSGKKQTTENAFPCCFMPVTARLMPGDEVKIYSLYGQANTSNAVDALIGKAAGPEWFEAKRREAVKLIDGLTAAIYTKTASPVFDGYCRQTYLDNLLRGGAPYFFEYGGKRAPFYLYSRKHGDPEREYNYFSLGGEYFAQGNGNFRDVDQNRRCDVLFAPMLGDRSIHTFFDLIQPDGYNPLVLKAETYTLPEKDLNTVLETIPATSREDAKTLLSSPFTPGALAMAAEDWGLDKEAVMELTAMTVCLSQSEPNADFSEGYWCDHWTYNLDLIKKYLAVYPEAERELLFGDKDHRWYAPCAAVKPRAERYAVTPEGLRQYDALRPLTPTGKWVTTSDGEDARSALIEKLLLLCAVKTATLDAAGMGLEMEGGKPGWYDALNGLPGLLGSSTAETCELLRLVRFTRAAVGRFEGEIELYSEIAVLLEDVSRALREVECPYTRWDRLNFVKERYRASIENGFSGARRALTPKEISGFLKTLESALVRGIERAMEYGDGVLPTYFTFEADRIVETSDGPMPRKLTPHPLPLFLEGPVHWLKLDNTEEEKRAMAQRVRASGLYDRELRMYKVNESIAGVSFEAGRARAFSPGWLENESVWLHMEYKYLLELLKSGLYNEFSEAFRDAAVPFMDPIRYGRSPLENVSFLASSANPDPSRWGRGYVARLSGSTAEFLEMWQIMFFGKCPFHKTREGLALTFMPFIPTYLIPTDGLLRATFLGSIPVTYKCPGRSAGPFSPVQWILKFRDGREEAVDGPALAEEDARAVRDGLVVEMLVTLKEAEL